mgnify:CR=1 FL=1
MTTTTDHIGQADDTRELARQMRAQGMSAGEVRAALARLREQAKHVSIDAAA